MDALVVYLAYKDRHAASLGAGSAVVGSLIGSFFLFFLARKGGEHYLAPYTSTGRGASMRRWFDEYGLLTVFVPALVPIPLPLKIPILCAGALGVHPLKFAVTLFIARVIRYHGLAWLGSHLGEETMPYLKHNLLALLLLAVVLFTALFLFVRYVHRNRRAANLD